MAIRGPYIVANQALYGTAGAEETYAYASGTRRVMISDLVGSGNNRLQMHLSTDSGATWIPAGAVLSMSNTDIYAVATCQRYTDPTKVLVYYRDRSEVSHIREFDMATGDWTVTDISGWPLTKTDYGWFGYPYYAIGERQSDAAILLAMTNAGTVGKLRVFADATTDLEPTLSTIRGICGSIDTERAYLAPGYSAPLRFQQLLSDDTLSAVQSVLADYTCEWQRPQRFGTKVGLPFSSVFTAPYLGFVWAEDAYPTTWTAQYDATYDFSYVRGSGCGENFYLFLTIPGQIVMHPAPGCVLDNTEETLYSSASPMASLKSQLIAESAETHTGVIAVTFTLGSSSQQLMYLEVDVPYDAPGNKGAWYAY